jgi:dienelactone hydrolase
MRVDLALPVPRHVDNVQRDLAVGANVSRRALIISAALAALLKPTFAADGPRSQTLHYESSGRSVAVDIVIPDQPGPHPAVLLLHGRGGLSLYGAAFGQQAVALALQGFTVLTPHYFDASASPDSPPVTSSAFETWRQALEDALTFAAKRADVDPQRIGVVGFSLGGFLAGVEAVQDDRIAALVLASAGVSTRFPPRPRRMPALLIVHSREDVVVPLSDAEQLAEIARRFHVEPEFALYDGREHVLTGLSARSADQRIVAFLKATLKPTVR